MRRLIFNKVMLLFKIFFQSAILCHFSAFQYRFLALLHAIQLRNQHWYTNYGDHSCYIETR